MQLETRGKCTLTSEILTAFCNYYETLYTSSSPQKSDIQEFLNKYIPQTRILVEHLQILEQIVEEVASVIKALKNGKALGKDVFTTDFYKMYSQILIEPLTATFNHILTGGPMPPSWKYASIVVLPNKDRGFLDTKSYQPISLLNQDYKIFTSLLARRLGSITGSYINQDQLGFITNWDRIIES